MPKPKSTSVKLFRLRIDGESDEKAIAFCKEYLTGYILVHHVLPHGNPHYHAYAETHMTQGNLSNKIKEFFSVAGGDYSNETCDPDRAITYKTYLFNSKKGNKARLVVYNCCSPIDIETYRANSDQITVEYDERMKKAKKTQFEIVEMVLHKMEGKVLLPDAIYDVVIQALKECRTMARPNHVKDIIASVMAFGNDRAAKENIKTLTMKFFSNY